MKHRARAIGDSKLLEFSSLTSLSGSNISPGSHQISQLPTIRNPSPSSPIVPTLEDNGAQPIGIDGDQANESVVPRGCRVPQLPPEKRSTKYTSKIAGRIREWTNKLRIQMVIKDFDQQDPISILESLRQFQDACDSLCVQKGAAIWMFKSSVLD